MKRHHLLALAAAAIIAVLAALWTTSLHEPETDAGGAGALLVPELDSRLNDVRALTVKAPGGNTVTLQRGETTWTLEQKGGYPADTGKVREFLLGLASATLIEEKTADPTKYAQLGVADIDLEDAADGVLVELDVPINDGEGVSLLVGKPARGTTATYVRHPGEPQSWLVSGGLEVEADPLRWLDRQILDVLSNRVQSVTIRHPDGETISISKPDRDAANFDVADLPEGRELKYASVANPIGSSLAALRLEDVAPAVDKDPAGYEAVEATFRTFDGLVVTARTFQDGETYWVQFQTGFDEEQAQRFSQAPEDAPGVDDDASADAGGEEEIAAPDAADATIAEAEPTARTTLGMEGEAAISEEAAMTEPDSSAVREEAETLAAKLSPWVYGLSKYKYDQLTRRMADLLEEEAADEG